MTMPSLHEAEQIEAATPRTSVWPVVLGVLSIVEGLEAMRLSGDFSRLSTVGGVVRCVSEGRFDLIVAFFGVSGLFYIGLSFCPGILGVLGGALLLLRQRVALVLHWLYALAEVAVIAVFLTDVRALEMRYTPNGALYGLLTRAGLRLLYPMLVMIWFSRPAVWGHARHWRTRAGRMASRPAGPTWPVVLGALAVYWGATGMLGSSLALGISMARDRRSFDWNVYRGTTMADCFMLGPAALSIIAGALLWRRKRAGIALCWAYILAGLIVPLGALVPTANCLINAAGTEFLGRVWRASGWELLIDRTLHTLKLLAWPTVLLIWLARAKVRAQVRSWGQPRSGVWQ
ncbi:MAG TPA: hypothetical protein VFJ30_02110 [Phycisphaerae bacterium]|nr:hypothetical protein [Phycisphaerae bacterium]